MTSSSTPAPEGVDADVWAALPEEIRRELSGEAQRTAAAVASAATDASSSSSAAAGSAAVSAPPHAAATTAAAAPPSDFASYLASLDPTVRSQALLDTPSAQLLHMPPELRGEAEFLRFQHTFDMQQQGRGGLPLGSASAAAAAASTSSSPLLQRRVLVREPLNGKPVPALPTDLRAAKWALGEFASKPTSRLETLLRTLCLSPDSRDAIVDSLMDGVSSGEPPSLHQVRFLAQLVHAQPAARSRVLSAHFGQLFVLLSKAGQEKTRFRRSLDVTLAILHLMDAVWTTGEDGEDSTGGTSTSITEEETGALRALSRLLADEDCPDREFELAKKIAKRLSLHHPHRVELLLGDSSAVCEQQLARDVAETLAALQQQKDQPQQQRNGGGGVTLTEQRFLRVIKTIRALRGGVEPSPALDDVWAALEDALRSAAVDANAAAATPSPVPAAAATPVAAADDEAGAVPPLDLIASAASDVVVVLAMEEEEEQGAPQPAQSSSSSIEGASQEDVVMMINGGQQEQQQEDLAAAQEQQPHEIRTAFSQMMGAIGEASALLDHSILSGAEGEEDDDDVDMAGEEDDDDEDGEDDGEDEDGELNLHHIHLHHHHHMGEDDDDEDDDGEEEEEEHDEDEVEEEEEEEDEEEDGSEDEEDDAAHSWIHSLLPPMHHLHHHRHGGTHHHLAASSSSRAAKKQQQQNKSASRFLCVIEAFFEANADNEPALERFGTEHATALNELVREHPHLLLSPAVGAPPSSSSSSSSASALECLITRPALRKVLNFDNKRAYFRQTLRARQQADARTASTTPMHRHHRGGDVKLHIRRHHVFDDSYSQLGTKTAEEIKGGVNVTFQGEEAVDVGGPTKEWFSILIRDMFKPGYALFKKSENAANAYQPDSRSSVAIGPDHLNLFKFAGRVIGKALSMNQLVDVHFTRSFYKHLLGGQVTLADLESLDMEYYKSLMRLLVDMADDDVDALELHFTTEQEQFGVRQTVELVPNGGQVKVTADNKHDYVKLAAHHKMSISIQKQIDSFCHGFYDLVPRELISIFSPQEMELLLSGTPSISVADLRRHTEYHGGYAADSKQIVWFWDALHGFPQEQRAKFLMFVTGTSQVPLDGFANLSGMRGNIQRFSIHRGAASDSTLPSSHTCFHQLILPQYPSKDVLREKLLLAVTECSEGFGFV